MLNRTFIFLRLAGVRTVDRTTTAFSNTGLDPLDYKRKRRTFPVVFESLLVHKKNKNPPKWKILIFKKKMFPLVQHPTLPASRGTPGQHTHKYPDSGIVFSGNVVPHGLLGRFAGSNHREQAKSRLGVQKVTRH